MGAPTLRSTISWAVNQVLRFVAFRRVEKLDALELAFRATEPPLPDARRREEHGRRRFLPEGGHRPIRSAPESDLDILTPTRCRGRRAQGRSQRFALIDIRPSGQGPGGDPAPPPSIEERRLPVEPFLRGRGSVSILEDREPGVPEHLDQVSILMRAAKDEKPRAGLLPSSGKAPISRGCCPAYCGNRSRSTRR
jgi:hypothetical protein